MQIAPGRMTLPYAKHTLGCAAAGPKGELVSRRHSVTKLRQFMEPGRKTMRTTRRRFVQGTLAATALAGAPLSSRAQPSRARTIRAVMQGDLRSLDPIWTTANISAYHGAMIYDTLFA